MPNRRASRWLVAAGLGVALLFLAVPVEARFADHPLLRLGQLDPALAPRAPEADCGPALAAAADRAKGPGLYEVARAEACRDAGRRRSLAALAGGAVLVLLGLIGLSAPPARSSPVPAPMGPATTGSA